MAMGPLNPVTETNKTNIYTLPPILRPPNHTTIARAPIFVSYNVLGSSAPILTTRNHIEELKNNKVPDRQTEILGSFCQLSSPPCTNYTEILSPLLSPSPPITSPTPNCHFTASKMRSYPYGKQVLIPPSCQSAIILAVAKLQSYPPLAGQLCTSMVIETSMYWIPMLHAVVLSS